MRIFNSHLKGTISILPYFHNSALLRLIFIFSFFHICTFSSAQYALSLTEHSIQNWTGLQSFAWAEHNGKWLLAGGRKNGLHGFNSGFGFPQNGVSNQIWVVDPVSMQAWSVVTDSLHDSIADPIISTNMQFFQDGDYLYMSGGYGWSRKDTAFITYPKLTALHIPSLMDSVIAGSALIGGSIRQLYDTLLAVCGAHTQKLDSIVYLPWGHRFDGEYSRVDTNGFFSQRYTFDIRNFILNDDGLNLSIQWLQPAHDPQHFRRRDYNLVPQIFPDGHRGFTGFTGVFQQGVNLPWLDAWDINPNVTYSQIPGFTQYLSQYHSAVMPLYDSIHRKMNTYFFGGMAQYTLDTGATLIGDTAVPFTRMISKVSRDSLNNVSESAMNIRMPALLGSNMAFIPSGNVRVDEQGILHPGNLQTQTLAGYLIGGIESPDSNISATDPSISIATTRFFEVWINPESTMQNTPVIEPVNVKAFPNPFRDKIKVQVDAKKGEQVSVFICSEWGSVAEELFSGEWKGGTKEFTFHPARSAASIYYLVVRTPSFTRTLALFSPVND